MTLRALWSQTFALLLMASAASAQTVKLDMAGSSTWWGQVPVMVAIDKGFFTELGIETAMLSIPASGDRIAAITSGSVAFSNLGRTSAIVEMARGNKNFYYFANIDDSPGNEGCWARPGFDSMASLRGKKIAANTSAQITMDGLLEVAGMTEKQVQFVNLPPTEMAPALAKGDIDAACVWEPLLSAVRAGTPDGHLVGRDSDTLNFKKFGTASAPDIMIISAKLVEEHPDQARKLAAAVFKGVAYTNEHPEDTAATVAHYFRKPPEEVLAAIRSFKFYGQAGWPDHMALQRGQMQYLAQWLYDNGKIPTLPDTAKWENVSFVAKP